MFSCLRLWSLIFEYSISFYLLEAAKYLSKRKCQYVISQGMVKERNTSTLDFRNISVRLWLETRAINISKRYCEPRHISEVNVNRLSDTNAFLPPFLSPLPGKQPVLQQHCVMRKPGPFTPNYSNIVSNSS